VKHRWLARIGIVGALVALLPGGARAQHDTSLPIPQSLTLAPSTVNVAGGPQTVGYTIRVTDDLSGVSQVSLFFYSPSGAQWYDSCVTALSRVSGDALDGTYTSTFVFPQFAEAGTYHLSAYVWDAAGNQGSYSEEALTDLGLPTTIEVISDPEDVALPQPQSLVLSATTVDVSNGPQTVGYTIQVTDNPSGVSQVSLFFYSPSGAQWYDSCVTALSRVSGDALDGTYAGTFVFPQYAEAGTYHLSAYVWDAAGNQGSYSEEALTDLGLPTTIQVSYNAHPTADAGANQVVLVDEVITFDGSASSDPDGTVIGWLWDFGDGASGSGITVTHKYAGGGPFTITLTVTDDVGATGTDTAVVIVQTLSQAIGALSALVADYNIKAGIANSLDAKLQNVLAALAAANAGQRQDAANRLLAFINAVEAQRGKELNNAQADALEAFGTRILTVL
jgi:chitodextrinase